MAKKKELDNLDRDMIRCKADGYGCHYGAWKARQERPVVVKPKEGEIPEGWLVCQYCGKAFKPKSKRPQKYCEVYCMIEAQKERNRKRKELEKNESYA